MKFLAFSSLVFIVVLIASVANGAPPGCDSNVSILCSTGGGPPVYAKDAPSGSCTKYDNRCLFNVFNCMRYRENQSLLEEVDSC